MDNSQSQEIKNRADIVEVVRESVPTLKPAGSNWKGLCPFHNEKTPSFMVSQDKQIWHCFGCNEGGDVFTFLMKTQNIEFIDALRQLADRVGVILEKADPAVTSLRNTAIDIHTHARELYSDELLSERGAKAREYIKKRGITKNLVLELGIGLSPSSWDSLYTLLVKKGFTNKQILASGLVLQSDKGKYYDRFRERLMFSLIDAQGQIIGMAGRTIKKDAETAKYINSPQTMLYNKSHFLYGFYQAKQSIREQDLAIIVEGYFDWITLYKNGYTNVVAVSGTALTDSHVAMLKRYTKNIAFALDTDEAGKRALERSVMLALAEDCVPFVLDYQKYDGKTYKDPDELVLANKDAWKSIVEKKRLALSYFIDMHADALESSDVMRQKSALADVLPFIQVTKNAIDKDHFTKELAGRTGISIEALREEVRKLRDTNDVTYATTPRENPPIKRMDISPREARLRQWIALLMTHPDAIEHAAMKPEEILDENIRRLYVTIREKKPPNYKALQASIDIPHEIEQWVLQADDLYQSFTDDEIEKEIHLFTKKILEDYLRYTLQNISKQMARAESEKKEDELTSLVKSYQKISDTLSELLH